MCIGDLYVFNVNEMSLRCKLRKLDVVMRDLVDGGKFAFNIVDVFLMVDIVMVMLNL